MLSRCSPGVVLRGCWGACGLRARGVRRGGCAQANSVSNAWRVMSWSPAVGLDRCFPWRRGVDGLYAYEERREQAQRRDSMRVQGLACQVTDALGVGSIAMRDQGEGLAVATRAVRYGAGKSRDGEGARGRRRGAEMTRLALREIEVDGEADRAGEIDADLAVSEIHQSDIRPSDINGALNPSSPSRCRSVRTCGARRWSRSARTAAETASRCP